MTVTLTQKRVRPDDNTYDIEWVGINYLSNKVIVHLRFENGDEQDVIYEGPRLTALRGRVSQFNGLRAALEADIAANETGLGGVAS